MVEIVLDSYIECTKQTKQKFIDVWKEKSLITKFLFCFMMFSALIAAIFQFTLWQHNFIIVAISLLVLLSSTFLMMFVDKKQNRKNIEKNLKEINKRYDLTYKCLKDLKFTEKNQIKQLCKRCEQVVINKRNETIRNKNIIHKIINYFLIPIYVAIISFIFGLSGSNLDKFILIFLCGYVTISIYFAISVILKAFSEFFDHRYTVLERMVEDINGVLDTKFIITYEDILDVEYNSVTEL